MHEILNEIRTSLDTLSQIALKGGINQSTSEYLDLLMINEE